MGSVQAMIGSIAGIIAPVIGGLLIDIIGARITIFLYAPLMIPGIIMYLKMKEKKLTVK